MFLDEFDKYNSQCEKGIKKISFRTSRPTLSSQPIELKLIQSAGNYDLFFNRSGRLLHSVHYVNEKKFKVMYAYNRQGRIVSILKLRSEKNELISYSEFDYDKKGRIEKKIVRSFYYSLGYNVITEHIHTYNIGTEEVFMCSISDEDVDHTLYLTYDDKQRVVEEKSVRTDGNLIYWNKFQYDNTGNLKKEISLNERGEADGVYEYFPPTNGQESGYKFKSKEMIYVREYSFTFNEKGHWINQVMMNDGEPKYFFDRTIEYY